MTLKNPIFNRGYQDTHYEQIWRFKLASLMSNRESCGQAQICNKRRSGVKNKRLLALYTCSRIYILWKDSGNLWHYFLSYQIIIIIINPIEIRSNRQSSRVDQHPFASNKYISSSVQKSLPKLNQEYTMTKDSRPGGRYRDTVLVSTLNSS